VKGLEGNFDVYGWNVLLRRYRLMGIYVQLKVRMVIVVKDKGYLSHKSSEYFLLIRGNK
jgi:hypothetical protein